MALPIRSRPSQRTAPSLPRTSPRPSISPWESTTWKPSTGKADHSIYFPKGDPFMTCFSGGFLPILHRGPRLGTLTRRDFLQAAATTLFAAGATGHAAEEKTMPIIDPHVHVWKNDPKYPWPNE